MVCLYPTISTQWFSGFWSCPLTFFNKYSFIFLLIICYSHSIGFHISYIIFFFSVLCQLLGIIIRICSKRFILGISYIKIRIQFHKSLPLLSYFQELLWEQHVPIKSMLCPVPTVLLSFIYLRFS